MSIHFHKHPEGEDIECRNGDCRSLVTFTTTDDAEARGRSGWFHPGEATVIRAYSGAEVRLEVYGRKSRGDMPPIYLSLPAADMRSLGEALIRAANARDVVVPDHYGVIDKLLGYPPEHTADSDCPQCGGNLCEAQS